VPNFRVPWIDAVSKIIYKTAAAGLTMAVLAGCVVAPEGFGFINERLTFGDADLAKFGRLPDDPSVDGTSDWVTELIAIGQTAPYRPIDGEEEANHLYGMYLEYFDNWHLSRDPVMSYEQFKESVAGWTKIQIFSNLGFSYYRSAFVPRTIVGEIGYPSVGGKIFASDDGDLVAAYTNEDGVCFVKTILCKESSADFSECRDKYQIGVFDASTGEKLDGKLQVKTGAPRIDPNTLLRIP